MKESAVLWVVWNDDLIVQDGSAAPVVSIPLLGLAGFICSQFHDRGSEGALHQRPRSHALGTPRAVPQGGGDVVALDISCPPRTGTVAQVFLGSEAVDRLVALVFSDRQKAVDAMQSLVDAGYCYHVMHPEPFHDKQMLYRWFEDYDFVLEHARQRLLGAEKCSYWKQYQVPACLMACTASSRILRDLLPPPQTTAPIWGFVRRPSPLCCHPNPPSPSNPSAPHIDSAKRPHGPEGIASWCCSLRVHGSRMVHRQ